MAKERLVNEFSRLIKEYGTCSESEKIEAWNLIADFALDHSLEICAALDMSFPAPSTPNREDAGT